MVRGALSDAHLIQLKVVTGTLNAQKYQDEILESGVRSLLDSLDGQNMVCRDDIARPHCAHIIQEYKIQQNIASLQRRRILPDLTLSTCVGQARLTCLKPGASRIKTIVNFATPLHEWKRILCLERMYPVNLLVKRCLFESVKAIHNINRK